MRLQLSSLTTKPLFILEPAARNTAAAVGLAAMMLRKKDQDGTMVVFSADHYIRDNGDEHRVHRTVIRAWGSYTVLEERKGYKIKRIVVNPGAKLSLQMHRKRSEHWMVVSGTARVTCGESVFTIQTNQSSFVPMGVKHRLENPTEEPLQLIEVQCGTYLGEDDITRYEDI